MKSTNFSVTISFSVPAADFLKNGKSISEVSVAKQVKMQIFYKAKNGKTVSLEVNPEEIMQQVTEKIQDKGGIRPCNVSLTKIDTRCHCGNFSLQEFLLEDISEEIDICLLSPDETDINETRVESTEIEEPALPTTNISDDDKLKQMKDQKHAGSK